MARHCPDCKAEMEDDGVHAWCVSAGCDFRGYRVVKTGKILREPSYDDAFNDDEDDEPEHDCGEDTCCCAGQFR